MNVNNSQIWFIFGILWFLLWFVSIQNQSNQDETVANILDRSLNPIRLRLCLRVRLQAMLSLRQSKLRQSQEE